MNSLSTLSLIPVLAALLIDWGRALKQLPNFVCILPAASQAQQLTTEFTLIEFTPLSHSVGPLIWASLLSSPTAFHKTFMNAITFDTSASLWNVVEPGQQIWQLVT